MVSFLQSPNTSGIVPSSKLSLRSSVSSTRRAVRLRRGDRHFIDTWGTVALFLPSSSSDASDVGNEPVKSFAFSRKLRIFRKLPSAPSGILPFSLFPNTYNDSVGNEEQVHLSALRQSTTASWEGIIEIAYRGVASTRVTLGECPKTGCRPGRSILAWKRRV